MTSNLRLKRHSQTLITNLSANNNNRETSNTMNLDMCGYLTKDYSFLCYRVILENRFNCEVTSNTPRHKIKHLVVLENVSAMRRIFISPLGVWYVIKHHVSCFIYP